MKRSVSPLFVLFLTIFIDLLGFGLIIPILPIYAKQIGADGFTIGLIAGSFSLMQFLFASFWGGLSDRYGRRPIILSAITVMAFSYFLFAHATTLWLLLLSRILSGIGGANLSAAQAYISDVTPVERRTKAFGILGAAFGLGFIFGPPLGGFLKENYGLPYVGYAAMAFCLVNLISAYFFLPESNKDPEKGSRIFPNPFGDIFRSLRRDLIRELLMINFVFIVAFSLMQVTAALMWEEHYELSEAEVGYVFAYIGVLAVIIQGGLIGKINKWLGEKKMLTYGVLLMGTGLTLMPFVPKDLFIPLELLCLLLISLGVAFLTPTINSVLSQVAEKKEQGKILGINQSFGSLARFLGPLVGGSVYGIGYRYPYILSGIIMALVFGMALSLIRKLESQGVLGTVRESETSET
ncbi:MAG: MFS transporter [Bacteroidota bacterium]|nr:MFS transporter [Bacteroidota bacterium]